MRYRLPALATLLVALSLGACDLNDLGEGDRLEVSEYVSEQPTSREEYAAFGAIGDYGSVWLYRLGDGPGEPPRLVRSIRMRAVLPAAAQVDARGYVWVAAPYVEAGGSGPSDVLYALDPHAGTVHRAIDLPKDLGTVADVAVYDDAVLFRSVSGGVGRVHPACMADPARCAVSTVAPLDNAVGASAPSLFVVGKSLFAVSSRNDGQPELERIDLASGRVTHSVPFSGRAVTDGAHFYFTTRDYAEGPTLVAVRLDDLVVVRSRPVQSAYSFTALQNGSLFVSGRSTSRVEVYDAATFEPVRSIDVAEAGGVSETFAFVAPDVLMLNGTASLNVATGDVWFDPARGTAEFGASGGGPIRLPQGHPLAPPR